MGLIHPLFHGCRMSSAILTGLIVCAGFLARAEAPEVPGDALSVDSLSAEIERVQANAELADASKAKIVEALNVVLDQVKAAQQWAAKVQEFQQAMEIAPAEIEKLGKALEGPADTVDVEAPADATLAQLEQSLAQAEGELTAAQQARDSLQDELDKRAENRKQLPELLAQTKKRLTELQETPAPAPVPDEPPELSAAKAKLPLAQRMAVENEAKAYEKQLQSYDTRVQLLKLKRDAAIREAAGHETRVKAWRDLVAAKRQAEAKDAEAAAAEARLQAAEAVPEIRYEAEQLAKDNAELVEERTGAEGLVRKIEEAYGQREELEKRLEELRSVFKRLTQKIEAGGLTNAMGVLLRQQNASLADVGTLRRAIRARQETISDVQVKQIENHEDLQAAVNVDADVAEKMALVSSSLPEAQRADIEKLLRDLLNTKRDTLEALESDYEAYFEELVDLDSVERALVQETEAFSEYIEERILWVKSGSTFGVAEVKDTVRALGAMFAPSGWVGVASALKSDVLVNPVFDAAGLLVFAAYFWVRRRSARRLVSICAGAGRSTCTSYRLTVEALAETLLLAGFYPALLWFVGWRLESQLQATSFASDVGVSLQATALFLLAFEVLLRTFRPHGLAETHFEWPSAPVLAMRRHVVWLMAATSVCVFLLGLVARRGDDLGQGSLGPESLGRVVLIVNLAVFCVFNHLMLRPSAGPLRSVAMPGKSDMANLLRRLVYLVGLTAPLALMIAAFAGYTYTAQRLSVRLFITLCLGLGLLVVRSLVLRWLLLTRRRLAIEAARKRREALREKAGEGGEAEAREAEPAVDLARLDQQTYRLVQSVIAVILVAGIWLVWARELPALRMLDQVELWKTTAMVSQTVKDSEGNETIHFEEMPVPITLANLFMALAIGFMTLMATANIPGLLELTVLQRLNLPPGERNAATTIVRYALILLGLVLGFKAIGIGWSKVQWLVAALGIGLGFGLQEIFANFISGIIILFERPIRVGDVVTVGGINGRVSKIRIRATWITDFDRKELVVPNKEFITAQLVNWTLSDSILRVIIPVGIAYGSDTQLAEKTLYQIAADDPDVLDDPPPMVLFNGFGGSSLDFELRVFCPSVDTFLELRHRLHMTVDQAFREANIEIAFPQQDVHVRSIEPSLSVVQKGGQPG